MRSTRLAMLSAGFGALIFVTGALAAPTLVATIATAHEAGPSVTLPSLNKVFLFEGTGKRISIVDGATNTVVRVTESPNGGHWAAAANPGTQRVYVTQQSAKKILVLDGATGDAIEEILVPNVTQTIEDILVDPLTNEIYVIRGNNPDIAVINGNGLNPHSLNRSIPTFFDVVPGVQLALDPGRNWLFVASGNMVRVFFASTGSHQGFWDMPAVGGFARNTNDMALDPVNNRLYMVSQTANVVTIFDTSPVPGLFGALPKMEILATLPVPIARQVAVNPTLGRAYVTSDLNVVPIDGIASTSLTPVVLTSPGGNYITVNPVTGRVYASGEVRVDVVNDTGITFVIDDGNRAPVANAGTDRTIECAGHYGTSVTLDGTGSSDPDPGTTLTYQWKNSADTVVGNSSSASVSLGLGSHTFTLKVSDGTLEATDTVVITVVDTTAPAVTQPADIQVSCNVNLLVPVSYSFTVSDACDPNPTVVANPASGSGFPVGTTTVTVTATDSRGNFSIRTFSVIRAALSFTGFHSPIGGADASGGSFSDPVRSFKLKSTIPVKFSASCGGEAIITGVHTLAVAKYGSETTSDAAIDATPQDAATSGNQFKLTDGQWHFNLDAEGTGMSKGIWMLTATLSDGSKHTAWIQLK